MRLRVNRREVQALVDGHPLEERVFFPGDTRLEYSLHPRLAREASVSFQGGSIEIVAPERELLEWAQGNEIGLYFELPANGSMLSVSIEKDLECVDGPPGERDPDAFPRAGKNC